MSPGRRWTFLVLAASLLFVLGCARDGNHVTGSGTIELDEIDVGSLVGGRVALLYADEGDTVQAGDTLVVLDRGELSADVQAQAAAASRAQAQFRDVQAGPRASEIRGARATLAGAVAEAQLAKAEFERIAALLRQRLASQAEYDRAKSRRDETIARQGEAEEALRMLEAGARRLQIAAARAAAQLATAQLAGAQSRMNELVLRAPSSGVVLLRNFEAGEVAQPGQAILTIGDPERMWLRMFVAAPELPRVHVGDLVEVRVTGLRQTFRGRVVEIATKAEFTPRAALTEEEKANLVFGVKVRLDPNDLLRPGLPAEARIVPVSGTPRAG